MRFERAHVVVFLSLLISLPLTAQQSSSPSFSAATLLQQSLAAQVGNASISDITLAGTARRIAGSDDESGTAVLKAVVGGASRLDLTLPSGSRSEFCNLTAAPPSGSWSQPDGVVHAIAFHNLISEPVWFFPAFAVVRRLSSAGYVAAFVGHETRDGRGVEHISVSQTSWPQFSFTVKDLQRLTQVEFYLDSTTFLPTAISFNTHPDDNDMLDLPVEISFSDYRTINGIQVPFRIKKSLNGSLILDLQIQTVTTNSGLAPASLGAL